VREGVHDEPRDELPDEPDVWLVGPTCTELEFRGVTEPDFFAAEAAESKPGEDDFGRELLLLLLLRGRELDDERLLLDLELERLLEDE
jgi:hypothetical protein